MATLWVSGLLACGWSTPERIEVEPDVPPPLVATLATAEGVELGTVTLQAAEDRVNVELALQRMPPGLLNLHVYESTDCEAPVRDTVPRHHLGDLSADKNRAVAGRNRVRSLVPKDLPALGGQPVVLSVDERDDPLACGVLTEGSPKP